MTLNLTNFTSHPGPRAARLQLLEKSENDGRVDIHLRYSLNPLPDIIAQSYTNVFPDLKGIPGT
jgi:hypothetical protein